MSHVKHLCAPCPVCPTQWPASPLTLISLLCPCLQATEAGAQNDGERVIGKGAAGGGWGVGGGGREEGG